VRILGLDTATWTASVGLLSNGQIVAERSAVTGGSHGVSIFPLIDTVLRDGNCDVRDLDGIAVSNGPGSFTGLRVGLSVAKGLARAAGLRLIGVPTLEALARTVADRHRTICALLDARKGELYSACFASTPSGWTRLTPDALCTAESLLDRLPRPCTVLGDAVATYGTFLRHRLGDDITLLPFDAYPPRGGTVATMGWESVQSGTTDDLPSLEPFYIRPCEAELKFA